MAIVNLIPPDSFSFPVSTSKPPTEWSPIGTIPDSSYSRIMSPIIFDGTNFVGIVAYQKSYTTKMRLIKSSDCENWTTIDTNLPFDNDTNSSYRALAYGNGIYVTDCLVIEEDYDENYELVEFWRYYVYFSYDGITWTKSSFYSYAAFSTNGDHVGIQFIGDKFITHKEKNYDIPDNYSRVLCYSTNGINWTEVQSPTPELPVSIGSNKYVHLGYSNVLTSTNGLTWSKTTQPTTLKFVNSHNAFANGLYVATESYKQNNTGAYSLDGRSWIATTLPETGLWWVVAAGKYIIIMRQKAPGTAYYTTDGVTWERIGIGTSTFSLEFYSAYGNGRVLVSGVPGIYYSIC